MTWTEHVTKTAPAKRRHQSPAAARRSVTIGGGVSKMSAAAAHSSILKQSQNGKRLSCWVHLSRTASGMDKLPAWFLRVGAPLLYKPVTCLLNKSIVTSTFLASVIMLAFYLLRRLQHLSRTQTIARYPSHQFLVDCWSESSWGATCIQLLSSLQLRSISQISTHLGQPDPPLQLW